jgi:UDP-N-acetylmuramate--alanine ligase
MLHSHHKVHFIGIGGIGMSSLAEILLSLGYEVSGSDLSLTEITHRLKLLGAEIHEGHSAEYLSEDTAMVVYSAAIDDCNSEMMRARERSISCISRGEMLADITRLKKNVVAVAGSHGKTTTTSMIDAIMQWVDVESTAIIGGTLVRHGTSTQWGGGDYLVVETDEHDGSFLKLAPTVSVVTNIDMEHVEYYKSLDDLKTSFLDFIHKVPFYGFSVLCDEDPHIQDLLPEVTCQTIRYGLTEQADLSARDIQFSGDLNQAETSFDVCNHNPSLGDLGVWGRVTIASLGTHNVLNALAALATAVGLGMDFVSSQKGLKDFKGIRRRMQIFSLENGATVVEDYAHHPTEIAAVLEAVKPMVKGLCHIVFQPHLYSRTQYFMKDFADVLQGADEVILLPIYPAREAAIPGVTAEALANIIEAKSHLSVQVLASFDEVLQEIQSSVQAEDTVLILGAGDVYQVAEALRACLKEVDWQEEAGRRKDSL